MKNNLLLILHKYWKYILMFILGMVVAVLMPITPFSSMIRKALQFKQDKQEHIHQMELDIVRLETEKKGLLLDVDKYKQAFNDIQIERDSLKNDRIKLNDALSKNDTKFDDLYKIQNYTDNELYEFLKNYKNRTR